MLLRATWGSPSGGLGGRAFNSWRVASKSGLLWATIATTAASSRVIDMAAREGELRVFLVAGEVSGDSIASRLMASLKKLSPLPVRFAGVGGSLMSKEGMQMLFPMEEIAVMGLWELFPHLNTIRKKLKETIEAAILFQPHAVVTVDSKGFSFRLLKQLKAKNVQDNYPVHVHYVAPSFWAWKGGEARLKELQRFVDHMLCIIPYEEEVCRLNGLAATYVGHPLLEDALMMNLESGPLSSNLKVKRSRDAFRHKHGLSSGATVITLLPGSRLQEVSRILPIFIRTIELLKNSFLELSIVIPVAPNSHVEAFVGRTIESSPLSAILIPGASLEQKYDAFSASSAALCASGSAVIELQLARLPCVVAYRAHLLTEWVIRYRTKLNFISLPNILMKSAIIPEVLFQDCTPEKLATVLREVILDKNIQEKQTSAAEKVLRLFCPPSQNMNSLLLEKLGSEAVCCPSMIAASSILFAKKQQ